MKLHTLGQFSKFFGSIVLEQYTIIVPQKLLTDISGIIVRLIQTNLLF